jgi:hypothetical protein
MLGWFAVGLQVDRRKVNRCLAEELVADQELIDAHSKQVASGKTDWDFGDIRVWFAELRVGNLTIGRPHDDWKLR